MSQFADFVGYSQDGQILFIAEVKSRVSTSKTWAARFRRNLLAHGFLPKVPFFLLVLPDKFYIWKDITNNPEEIEPTYEINALPLLRSYYDKSGTTPETITEQSLELLLTSWFNDIVQIGISNDIPQEERDIIIKSGIIEALKGGHIGYQVGV